MNLFKKLTAPIILLFRRRIRRKWQRHSFLNRRILDYRGTFPLRPGKYRFNYEWWEVWGPPKIGETATQYMVYVRANGRILREKETLVEVEPE